MGNWTSETLQKMSNYIRKSAKIRLEYGRVEVSNFRRKEAVHFEKKTRISDNAEEEYSSSSGIRKRRIHRNCGNSKRSA